MRLRLAALVFVLPVLLALAAFEPALWRKAVLVFLAAALLVISVSEELRFKRFGVGETALRVNLAAGVVGPLVLAGATGALESPFLPLAILVAFLLGVVLAPPGLFVAGLGQVVVVWLFAAAAANGWVSDLNPALFGGGSRAGHSNLHLWAFAFFMSLGVVAGAALGRVVRRMFEQMVAEARRGQEDLLRAHAERAQELTALTGEIAHELKNPLSSVKGLAGLLETQAADDKARERVAVLRREVDRMQAVLDEFLNFSRPLVPLSIRPVGLGELCREVAALHEGVARERGVGVEVRAAEEVLSCDPRKVRQVLINLVQNALEASPTGTSVELDARGEDGMVRVQVLDRGPGLAQAISERAFEPGVTTKPRGSGLGLTIARALARQHGGEVTLAPRPGGGLAAEMRLPASSELQRRHA